MTNQKRNHRANALVAVFAMSLLLAAIVGCPSAAGPGESMQPVPVDTEDPRPTDDNAAGNDTGDSVVGEPDGGPCMDRDGCPDDPGDVDGDGVPNMIDRCPATPAGTPVDGSGCPTQDNPDVVVDPDPADTTNDPTNDPGDVSDPADTSGDTGGGSSGGGDSGGGSTGGGDTGGGDTGGGDSGGGDTGGGSGGGGSGAVCGNSIVEVGEGCDPPNGTTCDMACQLIISDPLTNDGCDSPISVDEGSTAFSNMSATTDGPIGDGVCSGFNSEADVWFCHTATCTGFISVNTCATFYDTTLMLYDGCDCPTGSEVACSDDGCEFGLGSLATLPVVAGQSILIRVGGFQADQGQAALEIACTAELELPAPVCASSDQPCDSAHEGIGCSDGDCCATVCGVDAICCTVGWDDICAAEAGGLCGDGFSVCESATGDCDVAHDGPGCSTVGCCDQVCFDDPFCCITEWDALCAQAAASCP